MLKELQKFILRGNVIDLAVAVVIGAAFGSVITALVKDIITPLIAALVGKPDFSNLYLTIHHSTFHYGDFLNAVISFLLLAFVVFFCIVQPLNTLIALTNRKKAAADPTDKKCSECLSVIPKDARRCAFCTSRQV